MCTYLECTSLIRIAISKTPVEKSEMVYPRFCYYIQIEDGTPYHRMTVEVNPRLIVTRRYLCSGFIQIGDPDED